MCSLPLSHMMEYKNILLSQLLVKRVVMTDLTATRAKSHQHRVTAEEDLQSGQTPWGLKTSWSSLGYQQHLYCFQVNK